MDFLSFEFDLAEPTGPLEQRLDCLRNVVAEFRIFVGSEVIYRDSDFPVVELGLALTEWLEGLEHFESEFSFDSRCSALPGLIRILHGAQGWSVRSVQQELPSAIVFPLQQVTAEVQRFVRAVDSEVETAHGFRLLTLRA